VWRIMDRCSDTFCRYLIHVTAQLEIAVHVI
jgi:hypothetical protein